MPAVFHPDVSSTGSDIRHRLQETLQVADAPPAPPEPPPTSHSAARKPGSAASSARGSSPIGYVAPGHASLPVWPYAAPVVNQRPGYVTPPPRPVNGCAPSLEVFLSSPGPIGKSETLATVAESNFANC